MKEQEIIEKIQNLLLRKNFFELHKYSLELLESLEPKKVLELLKTSSKGIRMKQDLNYLEDELQLVEDIIVHVNKEQVYIDEEYKEEYIDDYTSFKDIK